MKTVRDKVSAQVGARQAQALQEGQNAPIALIDIGSNTIRLVIFDGLSRTPLVIYTEKAACGLGADLNETGKLSVHGQEKARQNLRRFQSIIEYYECEKIHAFATAAARQASDGRKFIRSIEQQMGWDIDIFSGEKEAMMAALGVLSGETQCHGVIGDLGGGSLELLSYNGEGMKEMISLPYGALSLTHRYDLFQNEARELIQSSLQDVSWLSSYQRFYAVGGTWRALGKIALAYFNSPFKVPHGYVLSAEKVRKVISFVKQEPPSALAKKYGIAKERAALVPMAALILENLIEVAGFSDVAFSYNGVREGVYCHLLPTYHQQMDPLLSACGRWAQRYGRLDVHTAEKIFQWISPLFGAENVQHERIRHAACLLIDIAWFDHPEYQLEQSFLRCLHVPFNVMSHQEQVLLGVMVAERYGKSKKIVAPYMSYLSKEELLYACQVGRSLRLASILNIDIAILLEKTTLQIKGEQLILTVDHSSVMVLGDAVEKRLRQLAKLFELDPLLQEV